jgi:hypothetical protein
MQTEFFRLEILTPVHIGTGDELDPMNYLMQEEADGPTCHVVNTNAWAAEYPDPDDLCCRFSGENVPQIRKFLADNLDPGIYGIRRIAVSDRQIYKEYLSKRDDQRTSNQLRLSPQMSSNGQSPIIPGSSLKGALRTAVIDWLDREQHLGLKQNQNEYLKKLERALGPITDNAFKQLKISDVEGWSDSTVLVEALEIRRKEGKTTTPKSKCEGLPSRALGSAGTATLYGKFSLGTPGQKIDGRLTLPGGKSWSWPELCRLVNAYLLPRLDAELDKFYRQPQFAKALPVVQLLRQELNSAGEGQMYLRVGHYSQVEFVTVRDNQPLTRKGKQGTPLPHGTTRTLANGLFPFGWVRITPCPEDEYRRGVAEREAANRQATEGRLDRRAEIVRAKQQKIAEQEEKERLAREAADAEAARQAELDAMSPVDRQLYLLSRGELHEHQVVELFNGLGDMNETEREKVAGAIKELWVAAGKWAKKECSKKQWEKVLKLKDFLGEP